MTAEQLAHLVGALLGSVFGIVLVVGFLIAVFFWPYLAWSAVRNIKRIREQLERLNDNLERRAGDGTGGVLGL